MLPGLDGFEVLGQIRAKSNVPVLMITGRGEALDRIAGLELGAAQEIGRRPQERPPYSDRPGRRLYAPGARNRRIHEAAAAAVHQGSVCRLFEPLPAGSGVRSFRARAISAGCRFVLLAPAQNRIMAVAHTLALELDQNPPEAWDR